ncbi:rho family-interacting cell polarization regulator 2 [Latimeria chalumnae]|uniref:rho family-interacting cell polarization regulator 2 n=1 Tax=Latimeria chalumnae TaxID=7897 RepID=UPI0006D917DB|nr:PREDICTED: protein FAM65B [Latimeria chalumnae]|eukprot:XP_014352038.1 PREDICTED: protein FAM65B [Latimeria chalumnae]
MWHNEEDLIHAMELEESEDSFDEGIPSRLPDIMSVGIQSFSPGGPNGISRSQSFAGFSTLQERRSRCNSFINNSAAPKKLQAKKMHNLSHKNNSTPKEPQPKRVEEVYGALKNGLNEYLEVHQAELEKLMAQLKDMERNSRLGVLYELDKQIKTIERYIRRLEFHISKVDELYEGFCIQRRLREGACKMKQAFAMSPCSKKARKSLIEIDKSYKEHTENMCTLEGEMEGLLGEFYIKMKGLAGFARLCPGDQYEIFMRHGQQRWKLKGKIEGNGRQSWDGEEMVFSPLINGLISIKVTELKGLATHILVGSVICETKDLFTARPQVVAVDINDLGTIKLNLEVAWYPFDSEDLTPSTSNINKAAALQRRLSIYSQGTPETPTFEERSFFSTLPDDVFENGTVTNERRPLSFSFGDLANGDCTPVSTIASCTLGQSNPEITVTPPDNDQCSNDSTLDKLSVDETGAISTEDSIARASGLKMNIEDIDQHKNACSEPCQQSSDSGVHSLFLESSVPVSLIQDPDELSELKPVELDTFEGNITKQLVKRLTSAETLVMPNRVHSEGSISGESDGTRSFIEGGLEEALQGLLLSLETYKEQYKELEDMDHKVVQLEDLLKCKPAVTRSRSSSLSLTVESALESFDFLNTSDFDDDDIDEIGNGGGADSVFSDSETEKSSYRSEHPEARGHLSEALTEDTGVGTSVGGSPLPLTSGSESLDLTIIKHLQYCSQLLQQLVSAENSPDAQCSLLQKISKQTLLLENLAEISSDKVGNISSVAEVVPELHENQSLLTSWNECSGPGIMYHTTVERMIKQLNTNFAGAVNAKFPALSETVFRGMVNQILDRSETVSSSGFSQEVITVFQFCSYMSSHSVTDLGDYLAQLEKEALVMHVLRSSRNGKLEESLQKLPISDLQPRQEMLKMLAFLLSDENSDISRAVGLYLMTAAKNKGFREKALGYYTEALKEPNVHLQKAVCKALKCFKATESIKILVTLSQFDNEEVRQVAADTLLSFGEEGRLACERLRKESQNIVKTGTRHGNAVTTAF